MKDATQMLAEQSIDGIFIDANIKVLVEGYFAKAKKTRIETSEQRRKGYDRLLAEVNKTLRQDNII